MTTATAGSALFGALIVRPNSVRFALQAPLHALPRSSRLYQARRLALATMLASKCRIKPSERALTGSEAQTSQGLTILAPPAKPLPSPWFFEGTPQGRPRDAVLVWLPSAKPRPSPAFCEGTPQGEPRDAVLVWLHRPSPGPPLGFMRGSYRERLGSQPLVGFHGQAPAFPSVLRREAAGRAQGDS